MYFGVKESTVDIISSLEELCQKYFHKATANRDVEQGMKIYSKRQGRNQKIFQAGDILLKKFEGRSL